MTGRHKGMRVESLMKKLWQLLVVALGLCTLTGWTSAQTPGVTLTVSPNPFQTGQVVALVLTMDNLDIGVTPTLQLPPQLQIAGGVQRQNQFQFSNGVRTTRETIVYPITALEPGEFKIESQALDPAGRVIAPELVVKVAPAGQMPAADEDAIDPMAPLLQLQMGKTEFYVGELVPITATLFIPRRTQLERPGLVDIQKDGFAIQRFPQGAEQAMQTVGGLPYVTYTYRSTLSALKAGKLKVGPATMEIIYHVPLGGRNQQGIGIFGMIQTEAKRVVVPAPEVQVNVLPLPPEGKPASFTGAVGEFTLNASTSLTEATVGDPVPVDLSIEGQGNFDSIQAPVITRSQGWKVFPARRYSVGDENVNTRDLMNQRIGFSVVLVPQEVTTDIPAFEFSYFNPQSKQYVTMRSKAISISIKPGQAPVPVAAPQGGTSTPTSGPADLRPPPVTATLSDIVTTLPSHARWAVALPAVLEDRRFLLANGLLAAGFLALIAWLVFQRWRSAPVNAVALRRAELMSAVSAHGLNRREFYRRVARVLQECGLPPGSQEEIDILWREYETENFAIDQNEQPLSPAERAAVLDVLKQVEAKKDRVGARSTAMRTAAVLLSLLAAGGSAYADLSAEERFEAAVSALEKKNYVGVRQVVDSLAKEGKISPELFELAGHAAYREGQPGLAAMWYQRAQLFPVPSVELRQNLRHVTDRIRVLSPPRDEGLLAFSLLMSRNQWALVSAVGGWLALFSIVFLAAGARGNLALGVVATLVLGVAAVASGAVGLLNRPTYEEVRELAFVIKPKSQLHTSATVVSGHVIPTPEGSVVRRLEERGTWTYAEATDGEEKLRGWIPTESLVAYWPYDPALLP